MQEFKIGPNEEGQRLDKFLHKYLKEAGNGFLHKMLRKKNITLNKKKADGKEILQPGDRVQFFFSEESFLKFRGTAEKKFLKSDNPKVKGSSQISSYKAGMSVYEKAYAKLKGIEVVYENKHILLLNKPAGILSQKASPSDISVNEWLIGYLLAKGEISREQLETFKPSICNRLDRNTSGLLICGKSFLGSRQMNVLIKERKLRKFYRTFVKGRVEQGAYLKGYLKKEEKSNKVFFKEKVSEAESREYVSIETVYEPLEYKDDYTYLEVEIMTGKTHQIRAHLAAAGHPLLGDEKYGDHQWNQSFEGLKLPKHQLLHAYRLEFPVLEGEFKSVSGKVFTAKEPIIYDALK